jgi:UBX domain-containing protein 7
MEGDVVTQFQEVTGSSAELATQYLEIADFDIEQAMQLYFENGGAEIRPTQQPTAAAPQTSSRQDPDDLVRIDSNDEDITIDEARSSAPPRQPADSSFEDDAAMARRLQEELYAGGDSGDNVRAPMARTTETLVGPGAEGYGDFDPLSHFRMRPGGRSSQYTIFHARQLIYLA